MAMALGPEFPPPDRSAQVEHRPSRVAEAARELWNPNSGLQIERCVVAGQGRDIGPAF